jgi:D-threo-aldose 1-dehydrogenase
MNLRHGPQGRELICSAAVRRVWDFSAAGVRNSLESSMERLGLDRVGTVLIHDPNAHADEALAVAAPALATLRDGVAFVPASAVSDPPPPAVALRPASPAVDRTVGVVWRADHRHTPAATAFLALLRERASLKD